MAFKLFGRKKKDKKQELPENTTVVEQANGEVSERVDTSNDQPARSNEALQSESKPQSLQQVESQASQSQIEQSNNEAKEKKSGFFGRLKQGLGKTSNSLSTGLGALFLGKREIDDELFEDIETQLLVADIGIDATQDIMHHLTHEVNRDELYEAGALFKTLKEQLENILTPCNIPLTVDATKQPYVMLMIGVNGVGKTTTIGKLAKKFQQQGKSVMLAAGDTFRAAAVEQLQVWGERNDVPVVAQHTGADSASVIYDAVQAAKSRNVDVVIADTAGRLHNKDNLMEELRKVVRVIKKLDDTAPHEVMLVLDATTGQNALSQAAAFGEAIGVTGLTISKLDGTAKGGIVFAICKKLGLPIRFIGVGEQVDDLREFDASDFVDAIFSEIDID